MTELPRGLQRERLTSIRGGGGRSYGLAPLMGFGLTESIEDLIVKLILGRRF